MSPRTEAGKRLLAWLPSRLPLDESLMTPSDDAVLAIEAEAIAARDAELAAAVEGLFDHERRRIVPDGEVLNALDAALALLRPPAAEPPEGGGE